MNVAAQIIVAIGLLFVALATADFIESKAMQVDAQTTLIKAEAKIATKVADADFEAIIKAMQTLDIEKPQI
jgi:hypothetical protein